VQPPGPRRRHSNAEQKKIFFYLFVLAALLQAISNLKLTLTNYCNLFGRKEGHCCSHEDLIVLSSSFIKNEVKIELLNFKIFNRGHSFDLKKKLGPQLPQVTYNIKNKQINKNVEEQRRIRQLTKTQERKVFTVRNLTG